MWNRKKKNLREGFSKKEMYRDRKRVSWEKYKIDRRRTYEKVLVRKKCTDK